MERKSFAVLQSLVLVGSLATLEAWSDTVRMSVLSPDPLQPTPPPSVPQAPIDANLHALLDAVGFTGTVEASLEARLGRPLDPAKVELGRLLFFDNVLGLHDVFGDAGCVYCHAVAGPANEMFSDFELHRIAGPQVFPGFGVGEGNVIFDGPDSNEDFGVMQTSGDPAQRYMFRTAPLRNLAVAPAMFHNGALGSIEAAIRHHLDVVASLEDYDPQANGLAPDLSVGPFEAMLAAGLDPALANPTPLSDGQVDRLVTFVEEALLDDRVLDFCALVPESVPSGAPVAQFQGCDDDEDDDSP